MKFLAYVLTSLLLAHSAHASLVAQWDFNAPDDKLEASTGTGFASVIGGTTTTFNSDTSNGGSSDPNAVGTANGGGGWNLQTFPAQSTASGTAGARFDVDLSLLDPALHSGIEISFDLRTSNGAGRYYRVDYTIDGLSWTEGTPTVTSVADNIGDTWHNGRSVSIAGNSMFGESDFSFRIVSVFSPVEFTETSSSTIYAADTAYHVARNTTSAYAGGTWRLDMVTLNAVVIPEPNSFLLFALGALGIRMARRIP